MRPLGVERIEVDVDDKHFFFVRAGFGKNPACWIADKALAPEFDSVTTIRGFVSYTVRDSNITTVCYGVPALNRLPG